MNDLLRGVAGDGVSAVPDTAVPPSPEEVNAQEVFTDLPDLHPHSGENFGKPMLTGD